MQHILLLHGAIGSKDQLKPLAELLKEQFHVHTINFSGHGGKAFTGDFSIPQFASEVKAYLDQHQLTGVDIFGYSMGGYTALYLARKYPGLVKRIITLATKFHWDKATAVKETGMLDAEKIEQKVPAFAEQLRIRHLPNDWKTVLAKTKQLMLELGKENALSIQDYGTINTPTLLLLGEKDKMVTIEETQTVQKALHHSTFKTLADTPHPIEQVNMELLSKAVHLFFNE